MPTTSNPQTKPSHDSIAEMARVLWMQAGQPRDRDVEFWLKAEERLAKPATSQSSFSSSDEQPKAASEKAPAFNEPKSRRREAKAVSIR